MGNLLTFPLFSPIFFHFHGSFVTSAILFLISLLCSSFVFSFPLFYLPRAKGCDYSQLNRIIESVCVFVTCCVCSYVCLYLCLFVYLYFSCLLVFSHLKLFILLSFLIIIILFFPSLHRSFPLLSSSLFFSFWVFFISLFLLFLLLLFFL